MSLRQPRNLQINEQKKLPYGKPNSFDEWPDESDLQVDRWQRSSENIKDLQINEINLKSSLNKGRSLPKSRRRRG